MLKSAVLGTMLIAVLASTLGNVSTIAVEFPHPNLVPTPVEHELSSDPTPPEMHYLMENTVTYFSVPSQSQLSITFHHTYVNGNTTFRIFDQDGEEYGEVVFNDSEDGATKNITFDTEGTYKMVAYGTNFSYDLRFNGSAYDWKLVVAAFPHEAVFRVKEGDEAGACFKVSGESFAFYVSQSYDPTLQRDGIVNLYDVNGNPITAVPIPSSDLNGSFEQMQEIKKNNNETEFWYALATGNTSSQSRIGFWTNESTYDYPTGSCTLLTPSGEYYFIPEFNERNVEITLGENNHTALLGAAGGPDYTNVTMFQQISNYTQELGLKVFNTYVSWRWTEVDQNGNSQNDDNDSSHINWKGFNFNGFDQRFSFYVNLNITPILTLQWSPDCFINANPASWNQSEIDEYAEFCLATVIHCVAPDLEEPPSGRQPYNILAIQLFGEPNVLFEQGNDSLAARDDCLNQYIRILETVAERIKNYPDERVNKTEICAPGTGDDVWGEDQKEYWISRVLEEAGNYVDIVSWDEYSKSLLEELDNYRADVVKIREMMNSLGYDKELAMTEFNVRGGVPTAQEFFGSQYSALYLLGAVSDSVNEGMKYPIYFRLIDSSSKPNLKGLMTSNVSMPPYSYLPPLTRKPQFFVLKVLGEICEEPIINVSYNASQLDTIASYGGDVYRIGVSNRYEAESNVRIDVGGTFFANISVVENDSIDLVDEKICNGSILIDMPAWSIYYIEITPTNYTKVHDVSVVDALFSKTMVGQGYNCSVNVTVSNDGDFTETFNVTVNASATTIGTQTLNDMPNGTSIILTFVWNTVDFGYGMYTITAYVRPVQSEINTPGWVLVTIPGDVNGDAKVTLSDLVILANAYGSKPGDIKWNPNSDINGNGKLDLPDLVLLALHYGQHYP
jgi:hypothetical protein